MYRPRLRSTNGCTQCRRRRKLCDKASLACGACRRQGLVCSFSESATTTNARPQAGSSTVSLAVRHGSDDSATVSFSRAMRTLAFSCHGHNPSDVVTLINHFAHNEAKFIRTTDERLAGSLLSLVSRTIHQEMAFSSLMALLALFMPLDWVPRETTALHLATSAIESLARALSHIAGNASVPSQMILTSGLLYLYTLHAATSSEHRRAHLRGIGALLKRQALHGGRDMPLRALETYLYHMVTSSTVNFDLVVPGTPIEYVDTCLSHFGRLLGVSPGDIQLLGVSAPCIEFMFRLSFLRQELLSGNVHLETVLSVRDAPTQRELSPLAPPDNSVYRIKMINILYAAASWNVRKYLLSEAYLRLSTDLPARADVPPPYEEDDVDTAVSFICNLSYPYHTSTWPLFILGLSWPSLSRFLTIEQCLERQISNSRLESVQNVLDVLKLATETDRGLRIMLHSHLLEGIMF